MDAGTSTERSARRFEGIDALRGIAALWEVLFHFTARYEPARMNFKEPIIGLPFGGIGVYLFFVISGYCIALTARNSSPLKFLLRRMTRLQPAYIACILLTLIGCLLLGYPGKAGILDAALNMAWAPLFTRTIPMVDGAYWSLLVEIKFYALFAALLWLCGGVVRATMAFSFIALIGMILKALAVGNDLWMPIVPFKGLADTLFLFPFSTLFLLGLTLQITEDRRLHAAGASVAAVSFFMELGDHKEFYITTAMILAVTALRLCRNWQAPQWLVWTGFISYPLYLLHQNLGVAFIRALAPIVENPYLRISLAVLLSFMLAAAVSKTVEHRFRARASSP